MFNKPLVMSLENNPKLRIILN
ncbi:hypothetical protein CY0110_16172 [Crocosphaera chwakensis CCY0110]|uniref:Uncharacterized protein n=1 Tax=Crocosphaera chwakensis CCY0110 TaxID=391612 RepID=A3IHR6_9CHRO|nr:hypothetical protein CY0110_16172 [Crocosphaera chwakensis CCY0110]